MRCNSTARRCALVVGAALVPALASAGTARADIVYIVNQTIGDGSVRGTLTTDGMLGLLSVGGFEAWHLTLTGKGGATFTLDNGDPTAMIHLSGSDVNATEITSTSAGPTTDVSYFRTGLKPDRLIGVTRPQQLIAIKESRLRLRQLLTLASRTFPKAVFRLSPAQSPNHPPGL
jgi:hypothetical protein